MRVEGWLLDLYPSEEGMVVWLKRPDGKALRFIDDYHPTLYVHGSPEDLKELKAELATSESVRKIDYAEKRVRLRDFEKSRVMRIEVTSIARFPHFARKIVRLGGYRKYHLFNVDIPHTHAYLYERDLFPLAKVRLAEGPKLEFELEDSVEGTDYELPPLRSMWVDVEPERKGVLPSFDDPIASITISRDGEGETLGEGSEAEKLLNLVATVREEDPDLIFTHGGDSWVIPYLAKRAEANEILDEMVLGREFEPIRVTKRRGRSYFSYGRIYYKPPARYLLGRIHVDVENSFIYGECGLEGLIELSRLTRVPLQEMARSSIGSAMSSIQLYTALKSDVLIPWMKREPEEFKTAWKLLEADRGGFIFEPKVGIHEGVGEVDFGSFYPAMMEKYNISPETVLCECCPDSRVKVPEIGYNICERRRGLIPQVLELVLGKRREYRRRMREVRDPELREVYRRRQAALKWILVTCFGYLGYRNARFGRIEAHESVTAFARDNLLKAARIAEENGFEVVHGIVDSLWLKKLGASPPEFISLCREVEERVGLPIYLEGIYRWIVFLPSKVRPQVPVLNRFYGVFEDGGLKARGIMMRRGDMPELIRRAQGEMLDRVSKAWDAKEFEERIPEALDVLPKYAGDLMGFRVRAEDLAIYRQLSRHPLAYEVEAQTAIAARQMLEAGIELHPGQTIAYVVTKAEARNPNLRVRPLPLIGKKAKYDRRWYLDLLLEAGEELFGLFGYTRENIADNKLMMRQVKLPPFGDRA
jgi:DNA polymerase elongation subunit (family B)